MMLRTGCCLFLFGLAACSDFPRDPHRTLDHVREQRVFKVGIVAPLGQAPLDPRAGALVKRVAATAGATPRFEQGDMETLLHQVEEGEIDLVIGRFEVKSPWLTRVSFSPPLQKEKHGKSEFQLAAAMRNGENGWIALIEKAVRDVAPDAQ